MRGGFIGVLLRAGLIDRTKAALNSLNRPRPYAQRYSDEECNQALHTIARHLKLDRGPRTTEYERARRAILDEAARNGELLALPGAQTIAKDKTWDAALIDAGFEPLGGRETRSNHAERRPSYTEAQLLEALRHAWTVVGDPFTCDAFTRWRKGEVARIRAEGGTPRIPNASTFQVRFDGWINACEKAIPGFVADSQRIKPRRTREVN